MSTSPTIERHRREQILEIGLVHTTMTPTFFRELGEVFREIAQDAEVRAVVVRGLGKVFSYGLDLPQSMQEIGPLLRADQASARRGLHDLIRQWQKNFDAVADCPVPVIAVVHGWCIGGGLDLISACDVRLCSKDTKVSLRETRVAMVADLGSLQRLPPIVGQGFTRELAFTGGDVTAERAHRMGLFNEVHDTPEAALDAARQMAAQIAANSPLAVRGVKAVLDHGRGRSVPDGLAYVAAWNAAFLPSEDLAEAMSAFVERRPPHFKGR